MGGERSTAEESLIKIVNIPLIEDDGIICVVQYPDQIPYPIHRAYFIISPVAGLARGQHTHKENRQMLICLKGQVRMTLDDGKRREEMILSSPDKGIMLEPMVWHEMTDMNENTLLAVLASDRYDPEDYIRSYDEFLRAVKGETTSYADK